MALVGGLAGGYKQPGSVGTFSSTYSHTPGGLLAAYRFLSRHGSWRPTRLERPWTELAGRGQLLFVIGPLRDGPSEEEVDALLRWVRDGNTLVYLVGRDSEIDRQADASHNLNLALGLPVTGALGRRAGSPLDKFWVTPADFATPIRFASPAAPGEATLGVRTVATLAPRGLPGSQLPWLPLLEDAIGAVHLAAWRPGQGRVFAGSSGSLLSNELIGRNDNLLLLLNFVALAQDGRVMFDEFHHGYQDVSPVASPFAQRILLVLAAQFVLLAAMFVAGRSHRFGPLRQVDRTIRRSHLEFVDALAELYRRGRAGPHVMKRLHADFRDEMQRRLKLPRGATVDQLAAAVARRTGRNGPLLRRHLARIEQAAAGRSQSPRQLLATARYLAQLKREVNSL